MDSRPLSENSSKQQGVNYLMQYKSENKCYSQEV